MADILAIARGVGGTAANIFMQIIIWGGIFLVVGSIITIIIMVVRNKKMYPMPVRLLRRLENGTKKEINGIKGGKVRRGGIFTFECKIPHQFKKHNLGYMPDFSKTDADNRLVFLSVGDGTLWQQLGEKITEKETITLEITEAEIETQRKAFEDYVNSDEQFKKKSAKEKEELFKSTMKQWLETNKKKTIEYNLIMEPIPTEVKTSTLNSLNNWKEILDKNKIKVFTIAFGSFIIMAIAHLVSLYLQTKIQCPATP